MPLSPLRRPTQSIRLRLRVFKANGIRTIRHGSDVSGNPMLKQANIKIKLNLYSINYTNTHTPIIRPTCEQTTREYVCRIRAMTARKQIDALSTNKRVNFSTDIINSPSQRMLTAKIRLVYPIGSACTCRHNPLVVLHIMYVDTRRYCHCVAISMIGHPALSSMECVFDIISFASDLRPSFVCCRLCVHCIQCVVNHAERQPIQ